MANPKLPDDIVTFEDSQGNTISNDPRYLAMQTLGLLDGQGIPFDESQPIQRDAAVAVQAGVPEDNDEDISDDDDAEDAEDYSEVKGADLKSLAKERGVEITKGMTAGQLRAALVAQDEANADSEDEEDDDEADDAAEDTEE